MTRSADGDVSETSVALYHAAEVDGIPYSYEYTHDTTLPMGVDDAFDMWINEVWVGGGFPPSKVPFVLEKEGQGRGREGSIRRAYYGLIREEILQVGSRQPSPSSGTKHDGKPRIRTVLYQAPTMPLPFHHYKGLVRFIPSRRRSNPHQMERQTRPQALGHDVVWGALRQPRLRPVSLCCGANGDWVDCPRNHVIEQGEEAALI
ncbi:hypothetical protein H257_13512 [Aphanomyces astaci]|uniref:Uncharacterized protein n=1 Tax=Aphanomyces astaci TaxID=112090 RepID=W4FWU7_APHAT|nr:hypothetical protein H257_13512 [Aphanomyces astaci]ETV71113.1 hypothetical protein H257_13512 [Aphanomyces astaci]|eukprot:XP_009839359.1 hypothetical protein H257_13512 [Aphanomyces astaci]